MGIFGKLDAELVPSNPFKVDEGEYSAEVTKAEYSTVSKGKNEGARQLHIEYTITDAESAFLDSKLHHYFVLPDTDMTEEMFAILPAAQQAEMRKSNSKIKQTLCGSDTNDKQPGLGVDPEDLNAENWDPKVLVGIKVLINVTNGGDKKEYTNIRWVNKVVD